MTKQELNELMDLQRYVSVTENKIREIELRLEVPACSRISPLGGGHSGKSDESLFNLLDKKTRLTKKLDRQRAELHKVADKIEKEIAEKLRYEPELREIIRLRYFTSMKWNEIADEVGYSLKSVYRRHNKALYILTRRIERNKK